MNFFLRLMLVCSALGVLCCFGLYYFVQQEIKAIDELRTEDTVLYEVKSGDSISDVEQGLFKVKRNDFQNYVFRYWIRQHNNLKDIKVGTYEIPANSSLVDVLNILVEGREKGFFVTLVEGGRFKDFLAVVMKNKNFNHVLHKDITVEQLNNLLGVNEKSFEGLLMPDTYNVRYGANDSELIKRAYERQKDFLAKEYEKRAGDLPYKNSYEALIMASIIEKETSLESERKDIASVFVNRLKKGMKLQTDPTVIYGVGEKYKGKVYKSFLNDNNPYNTYIIDGLPPTPIAMPSKDSIIAALHPNETEFLYFVAKGPNPQEGHVFTKTLKQHEQAVAEYRKKVRDFKKAQKLKLPKN